MNKIFTLIVLFFAASHFTAVAQTNTCNAEFQYSTTGNIVNFLPVTSATDTVYLHHLWVFGDGSAASEYYSPSHTYIKHGTYTVTHYTKRVTPNGLVCSDSFTRVVTIANDLPCNLDVSIIYARNAETGGLYFSPNVRGAQIDSAKWSFGDGTYSKDISASHSFNPDGKYTICVLVYSGNCKADTCITLDIPVVMDCGIRGGVVQTYLKDLLNPLQVTFDGGGFTLGTYNEKRIWSFGDGSTEENPQPTHTYASPGTYKVCLTRQYRYMSIPTSIAGGAWICQYDSCFNITVGDVPASCNLKAAFSFKRDSIQTNKVYFTNLSSSANDIKSVKWNFGDGTYSDNLNPTHVFPSSGLYNVCLLVRRDSTCAADTCMYVQVQIPPPTTCSVTPDFTWTTDVTQPFKIKFINTSTSLEPVDSVKWEFGDGTKSNDRNVTHTYNAPGTYNVCLIIKKMNSAGEMVCSKYTCKTVVVQGNACILETDFSWTDSMQNNAIQFTNLSKPFEPTDTIRWNFGDGTPVSYDVNPKHIYTTPGTYNVCIRVKKKQANGAAPCVKELCKTIVVKPSCALQAYFGYVKDSTGLGSTYHFTNYTAPEIHNSDSVTWSFGDGGSSHEVNPTHTFTSPGIYNICLTVKNNLTASPLPCISTFCKTIVVEPQPCNFYINFDWKADSTNSKKINFINLSQSGANTSAVTWSFGDGTTGSAWNPDHIYTQPGTYNVCLIIKTPDNCVKDICKEIVVQAPPPPPCNIEPKFTWKLDAANNKKVYFTNNITTTANAMLTWSFGDGHSATAWNPDHIYPEPGKYYACLKVQIGNDCIKTICDTVIIPTSPTDECQAISLFTFEKSNTDNQRYIFKPINPNAAIDYTWTFGDSTGSHNMQVEHRYADSGTYTACLTVYKNAGCATTTCKEIQVHGNPIIYPCDTLVVKYGFQRDPATPNKIYFVATGNANIIEQKWTITSYASGLTVATINQNNPVYNFPDTGSYYVCLRAVTSGGCVKEYCNNVRIEKIQTPCTLTTYPNPAQSQVTITLYETSPELIHVYVYDLQNQLVKQKDFSGVTGNNTITINIETLPVGVYTVKLIYGNNVCHTKFQKF